MNHVSRNDITWESWRSPKGAFDAADLDYADRMQASASGHPFDMTVIRIPLGKRPWPYHSHANQWEFYYVMEGEGEMRLEEGPVPIHPGDAMMCPPGEAHQLDNTGESDLVVQIIADSPSVDVCHYPDSGKWAAAGRLFRMQETAGYYDGEE